MDGYDVLVLVDTVAQQDGPPGPLYVIEPDLSLRRRRRPAARVMLDPHDLRREGCCAAAFARWWSTGSWWSAAPPGAWRTASGSSATVEAVRPTAASWCWRSCRRELVTRITARGGGPMLRKLLLLGVSPLLAAAGQESWPDIQRYLRDAEHVTGARFERVGTSRRFAPMVRRSCLSLSCASQARHSAQNSTGPGSARAVRVTRSEARCLAGTSGGCVAAAVLPSVAARVGEAHQPGQRALEGARGSGSLATSVRPRAQGSRAPCWSFTPIRRSRGRPPSGSAPGRDGAHGAAR